MKRLINKLLLALITSTIAVAPVSAKFQFNCGIKLPDSICTQDIENLVAASTARGAILATLGGFVGSRLATFIKDCVSGDRSQDDSKDKSNFATLVSSVVQYVGFIGGAAIANKLAIDYLFRVLPLDK